MPMTGQMRMWLLVLPIAGLCYACKPKNSLSYSGFIIGETNDIKPATEAELDRLLDDKDAGDRFALIVTRRKSGEVKYCSGAIVQPSESNPKRVVLTNHHCFAENESSSTLMEEACTGTTAYFGFFLGDERSERKLKCQPGTLRTNPVLDLARFETDPSPPGAPLTIWEGEESQLWGQNVFIVHFPSEDSLKQKMQGLGVKLPTAAISQDNCTVLSAFRKEEWFIDPALPYSIKHTCDLVHGSSGSMLLHREKRQVVAVNWGGVRIKYPDREEVVNAATAARYLRAFLNDDDLSQGARSLDAGPKSEGLPPPLVANESESPPPEKESSAEKARRKVSCGVVPTLRERY